MRPNLAFRGTAMAANLAFARARGFGMLTVNGPNGPLPTEALHGHLDALSARFGGDLAPNTPWVSSKMTEGVMDRMMRMILPFRLMVEAFDGKWKLSQNKDAAVRLAAADALLLQPTDGAEQARSALMRAAL